MGWFPSCSGPVCLHKRACLPPDMHKTACLLALFHAHAAGAMARPNDEALSVSKAMVLQPFLGQEFMWWMPVCAAQHSRG